MLRKNEIANPTANAPITTHEPISAHVYADGEDESRQRLTDRLCDDRHTDDRAKDEQRRGKEITERLSLQKVDARDHSCRRDDSRVKSCGRTSLCTDPDLRSLTRHDRTDQLAEPEHHCAQSLRPPT